MFDDDLSETDFEPVELGCSSIPSPPLGQMARKAKAKAPNQDNDKVPEVVYTVEHVGGNRVMRNGLGDSSKLPIIKIIT